MGFDFGAFFVGAWPSLMWLVLLVVFAVVEALTVGLTSIWFATGALGALIASVFTNRLLLQAAVFLVVSLVMLLVMRPVAKNHLMIRRVATNADRVIGAEGVVTQAIDNLQACGQVTVLGVQWTARGEALERIPAGTRVRVLRIEGVKIFVVPVETPVVAQ